MQFLAETAEFIATALGGSITGSKVNDELQKRGLSGTKKFLTGSLTGAALTSILVGTYKLFFKNNRVDVNRPFQVKLPNLPELNMKEGWYQFENAADFQRWAESLTPDAAIVIMLLISVYDESPVFWYQWIKQV
jgi:hypothetical protein